MEKALQIWTGLRGRCPELKAEDFSIHSMVDEIFGCEYFFHSEKVLFGALYPTVARTCMHPMHLLAGAAEPPWQSANDGLMAHRHEYVYRT